jgi:16S rRNA (guanine1207-N2)-methyltransferase
MRSSRLNQALDTDLFQLPEAGLIAVYRPRMSDDLSALRLDRVVVRTGFRPDHDHFARTFKVDADPPYAAALVCLPRSRDGARALLAQASAETLPGGPIAVDGQKTDGIDAMLKDLRQRVDLSESLSKAHGKLAVFQNPAVGFADWAAHPRAVAEGFQTLPGVFSADEPDPGSILLAAALPQRLGGKVVDLGAGWGYLARHILSRPEVRRLDLVEAEADALAAARLNIADPRAAFHWADAVTFRPASLADAVVMNPPFHLGRAADPLLGAAFIQAARRMLAPDGSLWLVANRHLPYDAVLAEAFLEHREIAGDRAFRVVHALKPRRAKP